jgi:hypothetical protein
MMWLRSRDTGDSGEGEGETRGPLEGRGGGGARGLKVGGVGGWGRWVGDCHHVRGATGTSTTDQERKY